MYEIPSLPYHYGALEPHIDEATMRVHHTKHHQAYADKLNAALDKHPDFRDKPLVELLANLETVPEDIRTAVQNQGGGYINHSFFWDIMAPAKDADNVATGAIAAEFEDQFGSFLNFKKAFIDQALGVFGSGWTWLAKNKETGKLEIVSTGKQDSLLMKGQTPLLGVDVWEHAYYLKYQNRRADYLEAWFHVINWPKVNEHFLAKN